MLDCWSPGLLIVLGTGSEAHAERRRRRRRRGGGEVERAIIRVGGCLGCLSWVGYPGPTMGGGGGQGWPAGSLGHGAGPLTSRFFMSAGDARPSPLM